MNFQLTSRHRPFIFKAESSISEGVPAGKVFATWGVQRLETSGGPQNLHRVSGDQAGSKTLPSGGGDWISQGPTGCHTGISGPSWRWDPRVPFYPMTLPFACSNVTPSGEDFQR